MDKKIYLISNTNYEKSIKNLFHLKVCDIKFKKYKININDYDCLIFTSKNSVKSLALNNLNLNPKIKVFVIGEATFKIAKEFGFENIYLAKNSHGDDFAKEILPFLKDKKVLYIRGKNIVSNSMEIYKKAGVFIEDLMGYENINLQLSKDLKPEKNSILIFTSPKNVESFICNFGWDDTYKAICIGKTTEKYLLKYTTPIVSKKQTIQETIMEALLVV